MSLQLYELSPFIYSEEKEIVLSLSVKKYNKIKPLCEYIGLGVETVFDENERFTRIFKPENWLFPADKLTHLNSNFVRKMFSNFIYKIRNKLQFTPTEKKDIFRYTDMDIEEFEKECLKTCDCGYTFMFRGIYDKWGIQPQTYYSCLTGCGKNVCEKCYVDVCNHCYGVAYGRIKNGYYPCICNRNTRNSFKFNINKNYGCNGHVCVDCIKESDTYSLNIQKTAFYNNTSDTRRCILRHCLKDEHDIELREDSVLCNTFIYNGIIVLDSIHDLTRRMAEMEFLYNYTSYPDLIAFNQVYDTDIDHEKNKEDSEEIALKEVGGYPTMWPWINSNA
jgi:hypothetical protein